MSDKLREKTGGNLAMDDISYECVRAGMCSAKEGDPRATGGRPETSGRPAEDAIAGLASSPARSSSWRVQAPEMFPRPLKSTVL